MSLSPLASIAPLTPEAPPSNANSEAYSRSPSVEAKGLELVGPVTPSVVRHRDEGVLSRLSPNSDVLDAFIKLRNNSSLSDEEAFNSNLLEHIASLLAR